MTTDLDFTATADKAHKDRMPRFDQSINITVVGKVSAGKSSLINAIMGCKRSDPIATVGARSGVTTTVTRYRLDEKVLIIDCPGLDDVRKENSAETERFLKSIDLGIFVVTDSADASQRSNYQDLKRSAKKSILVLNKVDRWDDHSPTALQSIIDQWKETLAADTIFCTCTKGYDPELLANKPMDVRGIEELKTEIYDFLELEGKAILLAKNMKDKDAYAIRIIATALAAVAAEAFIPGSSAYITVTQIVALTSLNYLYTGEVLAKSSAISLLPVFAGQSIGTSLFLWAKSFLPPTLVLDFAAAGIAAMITFAMLAAVKSLLESGHDLSETKLLADTFLKFKSAGTKIKDMPFSALKNKEELFKFVQKLLSTK